MHVTYTVTDVVENILSSTPSISSFLLGESVFGLGLWAPIGKFNDSAIYPFYGRRRRGRVDLTVKSTRTEIQSSKVTLPKLLSYWIGVSGDEIHVPRTI